jgi:SAM-dependent methyltransferase
MQLIHKFIRNPKSIVSVGVGSGAELIALAKQFNPLHTQIYGLDLSKNAIDNVAEMMKDQKLEVNFIVGSATNVHFQKNSIDVIIESSLLHEIYSYMPDGKKSWVEAISTVPWQMANNGIFILRDFSLPDYNGNVEIKFISDFSIKFYNYFQKYYRIFEGWNGKQNKVMSNLEVEYNSYPLLNASNSISIPFSKAAELILHFKNFYQDYKNNSVTFGDLKWKEINETYFIPNPLKSEFSPIAKNEYVQAVLKTTKNVMQGTGYELICIQDMISTKEKMVELFKYHFRLNSTSNTAIDEHDLFLEATGKMELVFKKVKIGKNEEE